MSLILNYTVNDILNILGEVPQLEGLYVYFQRKEIKEIPFSFPYRTNNFTIHFIASGETEVKLNLIDYNLKSHDLIVIPPNTVIQFNWLKEKTKLITICFSMDFAFNNSLSKNDISALDFFSSIRNEIISLDKKQWESFIMIATLLENKNSTESEKNYQKEMISTTFKLFLYELAIAYKNNKGTLKNSFSRKEELTSRFLKILENNYKNRRSIEFYSENLFVSSSHLSKVIKEISGRTVGQLLNDYIITEAKLLLADPTLSIVQVSNELEFSDQSFFGKFFKRNTGLTPSQYRIRRGTFIKS